MTKIIAGNKPRHVPVAQSPEDDDDGNIGGDIGGGGSSEPGRRQHQQPSSSYLSPAAASALASTAPCDDDDDDSRGCGGDDDKDVACGDVDGASDDADGVPSALSASPHSSAPPSPVGSVAECPGYNNAVVAEMAPTPYSEDEEDDAPRRQSVGSGAAAADGSSGGGGDRCGDPYADVRERMEALSLRDRTRHAHREGTTSGEEGGGALCSPLLNHQDITLFAAVTTYLGYVVLIVTGHVRDLCAKAFRRGRYFRSNNRDGKGGGQADWQGNYPSDDLVRYAPLLKSWENFYTRRLYHRIQDCFNRPIASRPSAIISILERVSFDGNKTMSVLGRLSGTAKDGGSVVEAVAASFRQGEHYDEMQDGRVVRRCLNLGSYNYLGFADDWDITCRNDVVASLTALPSSVGSSRLELGTTSLHRKVERIVASFVGKEDAVALNMGFNTNATVIPALTTRGDLIVSDELNHTSIVNGARASGAAIRTFRHNDASDLEMVLRESIVYGQPRTRRPWNRILVVVEGIYSMEGEYCDLRSVVSVCKKYGAYVYLDEAHSIGAMGRTGRGCCEYTGVSPADVDVMMGTFTKSFGGMGGYVAADKRVIDELRGECAGSVYHGSLSPVVCQQIISSFEVIMGNDGTSIGRRKLNALRDNSNYFRMRLIDMGLHVLGNYDSPIMPVMLYNPTKIAAFSRECLKRGLAVVVVGFPAVPILMSRARFCISAGHTREQLDRALRELDEIADLLKLRYARSTFG